MQPTYIVCLYTNWRDMVHGCMVYTERVPRLTAAVSRGTSHETTRKQRCNLVHHFSEYTKRAV